MLDSLEVLISRFAAKDAEIAYYREREWLIVDARDSLVDDFDVAALEQVAEFERLVDLNLAGSKVTNGSMLHIAKCFRIESLDIGRTQCDEQCLKSLLGLSKLKGLGLSEISLRTQFAILLQLPILDVLDLSQSYPTRDEVRSLLTSSNVSTLNLSGNGFQPEDFADLDELDDDSRTVSIELDQGVRVVLERPRSAKSPG
jgi:hypothetical protein